MKSIERAVALWASMPVENSGKCVDMIKRAIDEAVAAERAKSDEELKILRRLECAVFMGDALACSPSVPPILTEYLGWCRKMAACSRSTAGTTGAGER